MSGSLTNISSFNTPYNLTGLTSGDFNALYINGVPVILADLFNKTTDTSDDIIEGIFNRFDHITVSPPLSRLLDNISISQAGSTTDGYLSSADWNKFNDAAILWSLTTTTGSPTITNNGSYDVFLNTATGLKIKANSSSAYIYAVSPTNTHRAYIYEKENGQVLSDANNDVYFNNLRTQSGFLMIDSTRNIFGQNYYAGGNIFCDTSRNATFNTLAHTSGNTVVDSSRNIWGQNYYAGGNLFCDSSRNATFNAVSASNVSASNIYCPDLFLTLPYSRIYVNSKPTIGFPNSNIFITGDMASMNIFGGTNLIAIGRTCMSNCIVSGQSPSNLIAIGQNALNGANSSANYDVAIGHGALETLSSGTYNVAVGENAGKSITTASYNSCIGHHAGYNLTQMGNTFVGANSLGDTNTYQCSVVGYNNSIGSISNASVVGANNSTGTQNYQSIIGSGINILGADDLHYAFMIHPNTATTSSGTALYMTSTGRIGPYVSSRKFKCNVRPLETELAEEKVLELQPVMYQSKQDEKQDRCIGLIAEDVYQVIPEMVSLDTEGAPFSVDYQKLSVLLLSVVKRMDAVLQKQQSEISELTTKVNEQQKQIDKILEKISIDDIENE